MYQIRLQWNLHSMAQPSQAPSITHLQFNIVYMSKVKIFRHHFSADDLISIGKTLAEVIHVYHHYNASER